MTVRVLIAFDTGASGVVNQFTLDDAERGVLNNTTFGLGGPTQLEDVTAYLRSVSVSRGRSRILDQPQAGNASVVLDNRERLFDPSAGTASPFSASIRPRRNVVVQLDDFTVFTGLVEDWNLDFPPDGDYRTTAACTDGFVNLAQSTMGTATRTSQLSGARVGAVLDEVDWPSVKRDIDTGEVTLQADTPGDNVNVLDYLQTVSRTEFGALFMDRLGRVAFRDRDARQSFASALLLGGTGIPFESVEVDYGTELLFNEVSLARNSGGTAIAQGTASIAEFGISQLSQTGLLHTSDGDTQALANYLLSRYEEPTARIQSVRFRLKGLTTAQRQTLAALEVADPVQVEWTPITGPGITQFANVDRLEWSLSPADEGLVLRLSQAQPAFVLDSSTFGILDTSTLGF